MMTSCLVGAGLAVSVPAFSVEAQENISDLSPTGGWSVSKMANAGQEYCALSRQYQDDIALTIGQNMTEEYSLALDFQKSKLNVDKPYSITLQPEAGQIRAYEMMPASARAMVIRLGYDDSFVKALEGSGQLKAEIDGVKYQFALPDFKSGHNDLIQCMQSLKGKDTRVASNFKAEKVEKAPPMDAKPAAPETPDQSSLKAPVEEPTPIIIQRTSSQTSVPNLTPDSDGPEKPIVIKKETPASPEVKTAAAEESKPAPKQIEISRTESKLVPMVPEEPMQPPLAQAAKKTPQIEMEKTATKVAQATPAPAASRVSKSVDAQAGFSSKPPPVSGAGENDAAAKKMQEQQRAELEQLKADNMRLTQALQSQASQPAAQTPDRSAEMAALQQKINQLQAELQKKPASNDPVDRRLSRDLEQLQAENASLKHAMQILESKKSSGGTKEQAIVTARLQTELQSLKQENMKLKGEVQTLSDRKVAPIAPMPAPKVEAVPPKDILEANQRMQEEVAKLKTENEELKSTVQSLAKQKEIQKAKAEEQITPMPDADAAEQPKVAESVLQDMEKLKSENEELKATVQSLAKLQQEDGGVAAKVDPEMLEELEELKAENSRLAAAMQGQEDKLDTFDVADPKAKEELEKIRAQMRELQEKNQKLAREAMEARGAIDNTVIKTGNEALKAIREYEKKYEAAQADNLALSKEIEELRRMQEDENLVAVAGDWDIEKATQRYNEAEREIKRLGMLLEQQRLAHRQEKAELEGMLFDPAVTEREQRQKLAALETKLQMAEQQLASHGIRSQMADRPVVPLTPMEERVTVTAAPAPEVQRVASQQLESLEIQRLNNQVERQNQQLQAYAREQQSSAGGNFGVPRAPQNSIPSIESRPVSITSSRSAPPQQGGMAPAPSMGAMAGGFDQAELTRLLGSAGVPLSGEVIKNGATQYQWNAGSLVGKGQILPLAQARNVDAFAESYIARARQSCGGDFASLPAPSNGSARSFEIACVGPTQSTSASLVFAQRGNNVIAIAHEAPTDDLDKAMEARDRIAGQL